MIKGKIKSVGDDDVEIELEGGQLFKAPSSSLAGDLRQNGKEIALSFSGIGESADNREARDLLNYLLRIE